MSSKGVPTAATFRDSFLGSYDEVRKAFETSTEWSLKGWALWTELMLAHPSSVLDKTAQKLRLHYWPGEPLRLDAVFSQSEESWFPVVVAIEHENDWRRFVREEVTKLLSTRCCLKVGITYTWDDARAQECRETIARDIEAYFDKSVIGEEPTTEYLFLIGRESEKKEISCWYSLDFQARTGPRNRTFQPVGQIKRTAA